MSAYDAIISKLPGIQEPKTYINFKKRLLWTGLILLIYLAMGQVLMYGIDATTQSRFQFIELVLGSSFGSLVTLGIGPIVTASIILQLMVGSKIIPWDLKTQEGRKRFQGTQKLLTVAFAFFEAFAFASFGAISPASPEFVPILIVQMAAGAIIVLFMDEVISKWGIGSGVSLFIAAGVTKTIFVRAFNPLTPPGQTIPAGLIPQSIALLGIGDVFQALVALLPILSTIIVFAVVVYIQSIKVEIPLAFTSIRGFSRRWPLNLIYTSNIPVILVAALLANLQLMGTVAAKPDDTGMRCGLLGCFDANGQPTSGFVLFTTPPTSLTVHIFFLVLMGIIFLVAMMAFLFKFKNSFRILGISVIAGIVLAILVSMGTTGLPSGIEFARVATYTIILTGGAVLFSVFWVATSGMDARAVSEQIEGMGMQLPGFRRDPRIVEQVLSRYIPVLSVLSGLFIGLLAAAADFTSALGTGTGILLTVMIVHNLYEQIATRYVEDMNPALRKFFE